MEQPLIWTRRSSRDARSGFYAKLLAAFWCVAANSICPSVALSVWLTSLRLWPKQLLLARDYDQQSANGCRGFEKLIVTISQQHMPLSGNRHSDVRILCRRSPGPPRLSLACVRVVISFRQGNSISPINFYSIKFKFYCTSQSNLVCSHCRQLRHATAYRCGSVVPISLAARNRRTHTELNWLPSVPEVNESKSCRNPCSLRLVHVLQAFVICRTFVEERQTERNGLTVSKLSYKSYRLGLLWSAISKP